VVAGFVQHGKRLLVHREFEEVVRVCREGLEASPDDEDGRLLLVTALLGLKRYDDALEELAVTDGSSLLVHLLRGEAYLRRGDTLLAVEALANARAMDARNPVAEKLYNEALERLNGITSAPPDAPRADEAEDASAPAEVSAEPPAAPAPAPARPRRRWAVPMAAAAVVLAAAVGGGALWWRAAARAAELRGRVAQAGAIAEAQTYRAYRHARAAFEALARDDAEGAADAAARLAAAIAFEFGGAPAPPAEAAGRDGQLAAVYRALVGADGETALKAALLAAAAYPDDAEASYLVGRAAARARDAAAAPALERSIALKPSPLAWTALGEVRADAGDVDASLHAFDAALGLQTGHPAAQIARARVLAAAGRVPDLALGGEPERTLERLVAPGDDDPLVSPAQAHLAALALAEVKLARGDVAAAQALLGAVAPTEPEDLRFGEALVRALVAGGDLGGAQAEARKWAQALPGRGAPHIWLGRIALAEEQVEAARAELERAGDAAGSFAGLALRGELDLAAGQLDDASTALDRALALRAGDRDVQVLRARVDLERGDLAAVQARLAPIVDATHDPSAGLVLGEALRRGDAGERARALLEDAVAKLEGTARPGLVAEAEVALARLDRADGRLADARRAAGRALTLRPRDVAARRVDADLRFDLGDAAGARLALDTLAIAAHGDARVLLDAARVRIATADLAGARQLLDEARVLPSVPRAELGRETARLALAEGRGADAAVALAGDATPHDGETWLLLLDAQLQAADPAAQATAADIAQHFVARPEESLATGRMHLSQKDGAAAVASFMTALQRLDAAGAAPHAIADTHVWLGRAQELAGRGDDAMANYREALRLDPGLGAAAVLLGRALVARNDLAAAEETLARALKLEPGLADGHYYLGVAKKGLRRGREARQELDLYLRLAPRGELAGPAQKLLDQL
jgi:predicted Zn-dependent protease